MKNQAPYVGAWLPLSALWRRVLCQAGRYCELLYLTLMLLSTDRLLGGCQGGSEDSVELRGETLHIYVDFLVGDTGVDLCRAHIRMPKHL